MTDVTKEIDTKEADTKRAGTFRTKYVAQMKENLGKAFDDKVLAATEARVTKENLNIGPLMEKLQPLVSKSNEKGSKSLTFQQHCDLMAYMCEYLARGCDPAYFSTGAGSGCVIC
jgi:hypothetical protein